MQLSPYLVMIHWVEKSSQFLMEKSNFGKHSSKAAQLSLVQQAALPLFFYILASTKAIPGRTASSVNSNFKVWMLKMMSDISNKMVGKVRLAR
jgi:hypothetical protein